MDLALLVYGISVVSSLFTISVIITSVTFMVLFVSTLGYANAYGKEEINTAIRWTKRSALVLGMSLAVLVVTPSEKTMYTMVGAYAAQRVAEDPKVQQLSAKVLKVVEAKLDAYILEDSNPKK